MGICGILWHLGGWQHGHKAFRWFGVPLVVCLSAYLSTQHWQIFLVAPFMVKLAPSYGEKSWLFKLVKNDFITRIICFAWYWTAFSIAFCLIV